MNRPQFSRRELLGATIAASALAAMGPTRPVRAQARATAAEPITPALVEAARKEGKLAFYSAMDLPIAEKFAKAFEARFPGITVRVERSGAERVFQRIGQEMESRIYAVDVVNSADGAHFIVEVVYPSEGTPLVTGPSAVFNSAPNPNAARLFQNWLHSLEAQQLLVDFARQHSVHALTKEKPGARRLDEIKLWKDDPAGVERASEEIKTRYAQIFRV